MAGYVDYVNVFQGNSKVSIGALEGVAKTWAPIKGLSGNTHPGAQLPFGKISACAYSGGYPTGYGNNRLNCGEPVENLYDKKSVIGVSHLHHSGTGAVGFYYNYALTVPYSHELSSPELDELSCEKASPGYYSAEFKNKRISFELTTDKNSAFHRYTFNDDNGNIAVDFLNDGLYADPRLKGKAGEFTIKIIDEFTASAKVVLQGLTLYFTVYCDSGNISIWNNYKNVGCSTFSGCGAKSDASGIVFALTEKTVNLVVTVSLVSEEKSISDNLISRAVGFDSARIESAEAWESMLSRIEIDADAKNKEIFYSNLYHSLVKPSDWSGESIYYSDNDFVIDFTTLWDIYKTQLPLLFTVYPEIGRKIINTYYNMGKHVGVMPNLFDLSASFTGEAQQARFLAGYMFCDAYYRNVCTVDFGDLLKLLVEILHKTEPDFFVKGECSRTTHTLDMSEACMNLANVASRAGCTEIVQKLEAFSSNWMNAFDASNGLLKSDSEYYEGNHWNYSFRPLTCMKERIDMAGGEERFSGLLDRFFGFSEAEDLSARFEGFNNETDMEAPYAYNFVDKSERLAEVVTAGNRYMFTSGEGGAPGNVDSGGLSACYLWNSMGIFPVSGQNLMLIGMPFFKKTVLSLADGKKFTVVRHGKGNYVKKASFNGINLAVLRFTVTDMMNGGTLDLYTE